MLRFTILPGCTDNAKSQQAISVCITRHESRTMILQPETCKVQLAIQKSLSRVYTEAWGLAVALISSAFRAGQFYGVLRSQSYYKLPYPTIAFNLTSKSPHRLAMKTQTLYFRREGRIILSKFVDP